MSRALRLVREAQEMFKQADRENRPLTGDERSYAQGLLDEAEETGRMEKQLTQIGRELGAPSANTLADPFGGMTHTGGPGDVFVESAGFKAINDASTRGQSWTSGLVEVGRPALHMKGSLLEGTGAPGSGSGGGLVPVPQMVPGIVTTLFQPLTVENLIGANLATTSTVRYAVEGTATSAAAGVAEAGTKPESTLGISTLDEPVKKIATTLVTSDELLEDVPAVQSFINNRLSLFINNEVERQLIRGTANGSEVQGLLVGRGVPIYAGGTAVGNKAVQLFKAMTGIRGSAFVEPEWIVCHPSDYQDMRLLTDTAGQFFGGGPFLGAYGTGQNLQASSQITGAIDTLWGKTVHVSTVVGAGTALVGSSAAAMVWNRGGLTVEATNSHSDHFVRDLLAIRAERRLGLTCFRPGAYCEVRLA